MSLLVVLVRTHSPGNLGSAARAVKAFGVGMALLEPRTTTDHPDARAFASGAEDLLDGSPSLAGWDDLEGLVERVVAVTSLRGRAPRGLPPPTRWSRIRTAAAQRPLALVFGPERGGLTSEELSRCDARISLPTVETFPTLNLAQAVAASLALTRLARRDRSPDAAAACRDVSRVLGRLHALLEGAGYAGKGRSRGVLAEIDSYLRRARPTEREVTLLLGALAALERRAEIWTSSAPGRGGVGPKGRRGTRPGCP